MSCHEPAVQVGTPAAAVVDRSTVLLVGNPNVGKSTLFNSLTGARQAAVNAPGTTVQYATGTWRGAGDVRLVDLPGAYSLLARSPDEEVTAQAVAGRGVARPDLALVLLDASALSRSLYLLGQVAVAGLPVVVALTMLDVASSRQVRPDLTLLAEALGVSVVGVDPRTGAGADRLAEAVAAARAAGADAPRIELPPVPADDPAGQADVLFGWVASVLDRVGPPAPSASPVRNLSDRIDTLLLRPAIGVPVFLAVMWGVFQLTTTVAAPLMDAADALVNGWLAGLLRTLLGTLGTPGWVAGLLVDGVLAGVGTVFSFAPLMALMFLVIGILEDCGYLARAAFVADRSMRALGLDGRAVLPLVVGFGCNLPALAATRTLPHARQRLLTGLLVPLTSCTARLTVYILLAGIFFPSNPGNAIFAMYLVSVLLVVLFGLILRHTAFRDLGHDPLVLALPSYQSPRLRALGASTWARTLSFVQKAGTIIVATLTAMWVLMAVPATAGSALGDVPVEDSLYGRGAMAVAPALAPAGLGDWHIAASLVTGFVAKEVVVGSLAQTYAVDEPDDPALAGDLGARLHATLVETSGGHPAPAAAAFMTLVLLYAPCLATLAEQRRLLGRAWSTGALGVTLATSWLLAVLVFQLGSRL